MLNIGAGEMIFIVVLALLILGPKRLPELARGMGKFLREFRRQTDDVRGMVEREFYKMDQEIAAPPPPPMLPEGTHAAAPQEPAAGQQPVPPLVDDAGGYHPEDAYPHDELHAAAPTPAVPDAPHAGVEPAAPATEKSDKA